MTTYVPFSPRPGQGFPFQATLDGATYEMLVTWNIFGQRWFITCVASDGTAVFHRSVVGSPNEGMINLTAGYFVSSALCYRQDSGNFEIWP
jgi:hypothetical protein